MSGKPVSIGYSVGALQQLERLHAANPKWLAKLTTAERNYLREGLGHAIRQLQYFRQHQVAINAALASIEVAERQRQSSEIAS